MVLTIIIAVVCLVIGWFASRWYMFKGMTPSALLSTAYQVRLTRIAEGKSYSRTIYAGDDLMMAKAMFNGATGPARTIAELYTRGNHTASRAV